MTPNPDRRRLLRGTAAGALLTGIATTGALTPLPAHAAPTRTGADRHRDRVLQVANAAMDAFDRGWRTGDWSRFLAMLTDDFGFWFPESPARGRFEGGAGRQAVAEWTAFHAANGNRVLGTRRRTTVAGDRVFYEYDSVGASENTAAYRNWEFIVIEVSGNRIRALQEYWGDARPTAGGAVGAP
ncbi:nuclear transport factor 2 family protein [Streptomyces sp. NBC_01808]|uniref:nuclear transport factor 2 family protein n=1 Tax=Streptomyces sp. NBC_01808 TaxID=2975947 RepID=UPI002DDBC793|nr:nuclear transport factor 2 family protein [Streptomyces sp. NBC_01808]WSA41613.1 nuclear transport factor 2 family protein [Streptomyces sp. NBC_01808]